MNLNRRNSLSRVIISSNVMEKEISYQEKQNELSDGFYKAEREIPQVRCRLSPGVSKLLSLKGQVGNTSGSRAASLLS